MLDCPARMNTSVGVLSPPASAAGAATARRRARSSSIVAGSMDYPCLQ
jgi:hypothetical protein